MWHVTHVMCECMHVLFFFFIYFVISGTELPREDTPDLYCMCACACVCGIFGIYKICTIVILATSEFANLRTVLQLRYWSVAVISNWGPPH